jgi:hypothetical protein
LYGKGFDASLPDAEKGLGLCDVGTHNGTTSCAYGSNSGSSYEIGDIPRNVGGWLTLDFSGLSVGLQSVVLASLSHNADYAHYYTKTSGSCTSGSGWTDRGTVTDNNSDAIFTLTGSAVTGAECIKFASDNTGAWHATDYGDYLVQSVWTGAPNLSVSPEPAAMTLLATGLVALAGASRRRRRTP